MAMSELGKRISCPQGWDRILAGGARWGAVIFRTGQNASAVEVRLEVGAAKFVKAAFVGPRRNLQTLLPPEPLPTPQAPPAGAQDCPAAAAIELRILGSSSRSASADRPRLMHLCPLGAWPRCVCAQAV